MVLDNKELQEFDFEHVSGAGAIEFDRSSEFKYDELNFHLKHMRNKEFLIHCEPKNKSGEPTAFKYQIYTKKE